MKFELSDGTFVRPLEEDKDTAAFRYAFTLEGKAVQDGSPEVVTVEDNGDLTIEGYAAVFEGEDRQGENFAPGAFERGIKSFLTGSSPLCYHHKHDVAIGKVLDLREEEGKGLYMKARVDAQPESSPHRWIYNGIRKGTISGLSVGGFFKRALQEGKKRIIDMDFTEISTTPVGVHPGPSFAVVAGKALEDIEVPTPPTNVAGEIRAEDEEMLNYYIESLGRLFDRISKRGEGQKSNTTTGIL